MLLKNDNWPWRCILPVAVSLLILAKEVSGAEQTTNTETALEQAETLLKTACGDPKKKSAHCELTDELATRAVALLDHADPFVRGIADWAITIRVAMDNDHRNFWPRPNPPTWFSHWYSYKQGPALLENDYVRQAVALGLHRGMHYVTPQAGPTEGGLGNISPVAEGGIKDSGGLYQTPWPLSEKCFLVSYAYKHPESANSGIYFIDVWGNKELIHKDGILEAAYPIPLLKRPRPPVLAETTRTNEPFAVCHLSDVYQDLSGIKRGSVKWLRISERVNWIFDKTPRGELRWIPANPFFPQFGYWTWAPVRVIGIVPVETDGSAHFKVPAGLGIYFQALDENFMEVRRMRSHIAFQPGEMRACLGCHESKGQLTPSSYWQNSIAAGKPPAMPIAPPWGDCALMDYSSMIQPILDRRCVTCHGTKEPKGCLDLTAIPDAYGFSQSYRSMFGLKPGQPTPVSNGDGWYSKIFPDVKPFEDKKWYALVLENKAPGQLVSVSDRTSSPWEKKIDASISQPKQFGSHQSKLILKLHRDENHRKDANLTKDEWLTLVTWVDANAPYTSLFFQKFSDDGKKLPKPERVALKLAAPWAKAPTASACGIQVPHLSLTPSR